MSGVTQTSLEAWDSIQDSLGEEQLKVLKIFRERPDHAFTDEELSVLSGKPINCITNRRGELEKPRGGNTLLKNEGYIVRCDKVVVYRNGIKRSVLTWKLNEKKQ